MTARMHSRYIASITLIGLVALLEGCATHRVGVTENDGMEPDTVSEVIQVDPRLDHFIAWIPRDKAKTASVAEALVHVELGRAKDEVGRKFCGGNWLMNGASVDRSGPYPSTAPIKLGGYPAWYYRISHEPGLAGCPAISTDNLYRELRAKLPQWITIKVASLQARQNPVTAMVTPVRAQAHP